MARFGKSKQAFNLKQFLPRIRREDRWDLAICIFIALVFWLIISLTTEAHSTKKLVEVTYVVSEDEVLLSPLKSTAEATISGPGWELLWSNFFQPVIEVTIYRNRADSKVITQVDLSAEVSEVLYSTETKVDKLIFFPVTLKTEAKAKKRVAIRPETDIQFTQGFQARNRIVVQPDSINIWGAVSLLDSISFWPTDTLQLENVAGNYSYDVSLKEPARDLSLEVSKVTLSQRVEIFTEKEVYVRIQVINPPARDSFSIFPEQVRLKVGVLQSYYNQIQPDSFRLVADLNGMRTEDGRNSIPLTLAKKPTAAISVNYSPRSAEYFFFKKE